ncbi:MAG TPA: PAS domain S-box protein, partial [Longimicrobiaceae bacterium]|nr:PAS domain S-box protein [Longimicrobiaceae bacterium]
AGSETLLSPETRWILEILRLPYLVLDAEHRVLTASQEFCTSLHLSVDEVVGRPLFGIAGGEWDVPPLRALLEAPPGDRGGGEGREGEHAFPRLGGRVLSLKVRPLAGDGRCGGYLVVLEDPVRPRRTPPGGASPAELFSRIVTDGRSDLVLVYGADGELRHASDSAQALLGYTPEELKKVGMDPLIHPDDAEEYRQFFQGARIGGISAGLAYRVRRKCGEYVWLGVTARPVHDAEGRIVQVQLVGRDITQRKRTEEALHWLTRQIRLILNSAGEGIFGLDLAGTITFINPVAARMLGYEEEEVIGNAHHSLFHHCREDGSQLPAEECAIHATLRDGVPHQVSDEVFCRKDGTTFPVDYTATPALEGEKIMGAVVTFRDITARREAEASLRRSEWLAGIGQTVLALRHEINNPLTSMLTDAALLEMEGNTPEEEREMVSSIVRQARRIRDVVHRLAERRDYYAVRQVGESRMLDLSDSTPGSPPPFR